MPFYSIRKKDLPPFIAGLKAKAIAPVRQEDGRTEFNELRKGDKADFDHVNTFYSPKNFFLPPSEDLFEIREGKARETKEAVGERIVVGLRPCDANALLVMDKVFLEGFKDPYYAERRGKTTIAVFDCVKAGENCFCESLGTDRAREFDLRFVDAGEKYLVEAGSKKGAEIIGKSRLFKKTSEKPKTNAVKCGKKLDRKTVDALEKHWDSPVWKKTAERCLSCGACTMVCPTCTCFDIEDRLNEGKTSRARRWDSCQFKRFTSVSGQYVYRKERFKRLRHFVFHKLAYFRKEYGFRTCVGCGRCEEACLTKINIPEMIGDLKK